MQAVDAMRYSLYLPSGHAAHTDEPLRALNWPAAHSEQEPPSGPSCPGRHRQSEAFCERDADVVLGAQISQRMAPCCEYVSRGQSVQLVSKPAPRRGELVPAGHARHTSEVLAPTVSEYMPAAHRVHPEARASSPYAPEGHSVHALDPSVAKAPAGHV